MGTIVNDQGQAPSKEILQYLKRLAEDKKNNVFIISDFSPDKIDKSLHNIPNLIIVANTGLYIKKNALNKEFIKTHNSGVVWKPAIQSIMEKFVSKVPGSELDNAENSVVWRYKNVRNYFADVLKKELVSMISNLIENMSAAEIYEGINQVSIRPNYLNKASIAELAI